jgi:hypothetical protein
MPEMRLLNGSRGCCIHEIAGSCVLTLRVWGSVQLPVSMRTVQRSEDGVDTQLHAHV